MVFMSSYKLHSVFGIILGLLFFQNPIAVSLSLIGANIPDNDHDVKKDNVYKLIIAGLLIFIVLYILKLPYHLGILLCLLGLIFYFASHRGFTHSLWGILVLTAIFYLIIKLGSSLILSIGIFKTYSYAYYLSIMIMVVFLSLFTLNRKILLPFILIFIGLFYLFPNLYLNDYMILLSIFIGLLSHIILDSFSSSGIKFLSPISTKKYKKQFGLGFLIILVMLAVLQFNGLLFDIADFMIKNHYLSLFF